MTTGGVYHGAADTTYTLSIDVTNGSTMGGGSGNVPLLSWTAAASADDSDNDVELLYPNHWYAIGTRGLMVKFTDAVFNTASPAWTIPCSYPNYTDGTNATGTPGTAKYVWSSNRGDDSATPLTTSAGGVNRIGSRGLYVTWSGSGSFSAGDKFYIVAAAPQPISDDAGITSLNYGNVTVSTESSVKTVLFEVKSGAIEVSTVKFGLQSNGTFQHHTPTGNSDTKFRFGTAGPVNTAGTGNLNGIEFPPGITATDLANGTTSLYATDNDLLEVSTADDSEAVGSLGIISDPIWLCIKLGAAETGANSSINQRLYFDYS